MSQDLVGAGTLLSNETLNEKKGENCIKSENTFMKYRNVRLGPIFILEIILRENKATSVYTFFGLRRKFLRNNNNIHPLRPEMERKDLLAKKCLLLYFLWQITYLGNTLENTNMVHF